MAFESVNIQSVKTPPGSTVVGWRQDLAIGDSLVISLTNTTGVTSYEWALVGRPEGSTAGGTGPEPVILSQTSSATFVVDDDSTSLPRDGTYIVRCRINPGAPNETIKTLGLSRLNSATIDGLPLRLLGGFETFEDTSNALVRQGWESMLNRLLRKGIAGFSPGFSPFYTLGNDQTYLWGLNPGDGSSSLAVNSATIGNSGGGGGIDHSMMAVPMWFPEAGTITKIGMIQLAQNAGSPRTFGWQGLAPNTFVTGVAYPGATAVSAEQIQPASQPAIDAYHALATVSYAVAAGSLVWMIFQAPAFASGVGNTFYSGDEARRWPNVIGKNLLYASSGLLTGIGANAPVGAGQVGWHTGNSVGPSYVVGQNFPAAQAALNNVGPYCLKPALSAQAGSVFPFWTFQWERT